MRELSGQDTFLLFPVIQKLGVVEVIKAGQKASANVDTDDENKNEEYFQEVGIEVMGSILDVILKNAPNAQKEINRLLAAVCETTVKEVEKQDFITYNNNIIELFTQEAFVNFFKQLFL